MIEPHIHRTGRGYHKGCPGCQALARERHASLTPAQRAQRRNGHLTRTYGLSSDEYRDLLLAQDGQCKICHATYPDKNLPVDHDHATGEVRGLLCENCNRGLGLFQDNPHLLARAADYLKGGL